MFSVFSLGISKKHGRDEERLRSSSGQTKAEMKKNKYRPNTYDFGHKPLLLVLTYISVLQGFML